MTTVQKFFAGITAIGLVTALTLPGRQTPAVIKNTFGGLSGLYKTVIAK